MTGSEIGRDVQGKAELVEARVTDMVIRLAFLGAFVYWSVRLVQPFVPIVLWAVVLTTALHPVYRWLATRLGGRNGLAAALVTLAAFLTVSGPVGLLAASFAETLQHLTAQIQDQTLKVPPPPLQLDGWPLIGHKAYAAWDLASSNIDDALKQYGPALLPAGESLVHKLASISGGVLKFLVSVIIAGFLFVPGQRLADGARRFAARLIAPRGAHFVDLAGATIRNVSRGVIGVALLQALLSGLLLHAVHVPGAGLLAFIVLMLCIVQVGPALVLLPVVIWAWMTLATLPALVLTVLAVPILLIDNVLKPILIARGLTTPMLVILTGVIGGTISYGLIGLFLGPIVLAVFYELLVVWVDLEAPAPPTQD